MSSDQAASVLVPEGEPECVQLAAEDLVSDTQKITGKTPAIVATLSIARFPDRT